MPGSVWEHLESVLAASRAAVPAHIDAVPAHGASGPVHKIAAPGYKIIEISLENNRNVLLQKSLLAKARH